MEALMPKLELEEVSFAAKLLGVLEAGIKLKPAGVNNDLQALLNLIRDHRAPCDIRGRSWSL